MRLEAAREDVKHVRNAEPLALSAGQAELALPADRAEWIVDCLKDGFGTTQDAASACGGIICLITRANV
jgi:hypothetical protein